MTNNECRKRSLAGSPIHDFITLCAYSGAIGTGLCTGDSGGALISDNKLIGIASWGIRCAKGFPDGFTRVSEYASWIDESMKNSL